MSAYPAQTGAGSGGLATVRGSGQVRGGRRRLTALALLAMAVFAAGTTHPAAAQAPLPAKKYMNDGTILLPVHIEPRFLSELSEVKLYVKDQPSSPWNFAGAIPPGQKEFLFKADKDGEYWFTLVTVNKSGQPSAASVTNLPPQAVVVLDREAPKVQFRCLGSVPAGQCVQCQVTDEHPDNSATRFEYQTRDKIWRPLEPISGSFDTYCIPVQAAITGQVRVMAMDRCGNKTQREFNLQECGTTEVVQKPAAPQNPPLPHTPPAVAKQQPATPPVGAPALEPEPKKLPELNSKPGMGTYEPVQNTVYKNPADKQGSSGIKQASKVPVTCEILNKTKFVLNYQIEAVGQSGVGKVEVWITKDMGHQWQLLAEDTDRKTPVELALPGEGVFGLTLVASNGLGFGGEPPAPGSQPDYWVEVDTSLPQAQLMTVEPLQGVQSGFVQVTWQANDKNLKDEAIDLYYATEATGPWQPIFKGLKNSGSYRWPVPQVNGGKVFVRLIAMDRAGNATISQTPHAIQLDDGTRPKIRIQGIDSNGQAPSASNINPSLLPPGN